MGVFWCMFNRDFCYILPWNLTNLPWKSMVGRCIPYWNSPFLGVILVFGGVFPMQSEISFGIYCLGHITVKKSMVWFVQIGVLEFSVRPSSFFFPSLGDTVAIRLPRYSMVYLPTFTSKNYPNVGIIYHTLSVWVDDWCHEFWPLEVSPKKLVDPEEKNPWGLRTHQQKCRLLYHKSSHPKRKTYSTYYRLWIFVLCFLLFRGDTLW